MPWTRRRARLASILAAFGERPRDGGDLVEEHGEHVVEYERQPLGRCEGVQDDQERQPDPLGQEGLVLWVGPVLGAIGRVGQAGAQWFLVPQAGAQQV